jgi:hypothetical protein
MEYSRSLRVSCDHCGGHYDTVIHQLILKQDNPELVESLVNDELFYHKCPYCGKYQNIDVSVVYADLDKKSIIYYFNMPIQFVQAQQFIEDCVADFDIDRQKSLIRIVSSQNELREKVILLENGLDDRIIEVLKLWHLEMVRKEGYDDKFEEVRCGVLEHGYLNIDFLGKHPRHTKTKRNFYNKMLEVMKPEMDKEPTPLEVSTEYAIQFVTTHDC